MINARFNIFFSEFPGHSAEVEPGRSEVEEKELRSQTGQEVWRPQNRQWIAEHCSESGSHRRQERDPALAECGSV